MVSDESVSRAAELLAEAAARDPRDGDQRRARNLLIAAALREVLTQEPIVVGGTAEDFYTADEYHETDLDLITWALTQDERDLMVHLGFRQEGRHWIHASSNVPVEMPESRLKGDPSRVVREPTPPGHAVIISREDLYLDRVRRRTSDLTNDRLERSAIAIAVTQYETMDWAYVDETIERENEVSPSLMKRVDSRVRRRARDVLAGKRRTKKQR
jgi:hypothetical protein